MRKKFWDCGCIWTPNTDKNEKFTIPFRAIKLCDNHKFIINLLGIKLSDIYVKKEEETQEEL